MKTPHMKTSSWSPLRLGFTFLSMTFACLALSPQVRAVCQDGCDRSFGNTFLGHDVLINNTIGAENTAIGRSALFTNTSGWFNTATGAYALYSNTSGFENAATGRGALYGNTTGFNNTADGHSALNQNTSGSDNTATGGSALPWNTTGSENTATGAYALFYNTTGDANTANGSYALVSNTTGIWNTAIGANALYNVSSGDSNIAVGAFAGLALTSGSNNIYIGNSGVAATESNAIRIGTQGTQTQTFIAGISGAGVVGPAVKVDAAGQLGTAPSSKRFKDEIRPMDKTSEAILALKPVAFRYKKDVDPDRTLQFGLVAEDVEKVSRDLVFRDAEGKVYSVRYEAVNAMLLNEFLKEHRTVQELKTTVAQQQKQIEVLISGLQEVSARLEATRPAPQVVNNNQ
jgi:endosialidase-like protein